MDKKINTILRSFIFVYLDQRVYIKSMKALLWRDSHTVWNVQKNKVLIY